MQPETRAVMELIHGGNFTLSVVLEGGSLLATYPYDRPKQHGNQQHNIFFHTLLLLPIPCVGNP